MKPNTPIIDPDGRAAVLITMPIPPSTEGVALYPDGRGRTVDTAQCRVAAEQVERPKETNS